MGKLILTLAYIFTLTAIFLSPSSPIVNFFFRFRRDSFFELTVP